MGPGRDISMTKLDLKKLEDYFSEHGAISRHFKEYELRPTQIEIAKKVAQILEEGKDLIIEAPAGIGRTLAYLIPAILFTKSFRGEPSRTTKSQVFISAATDSLLKQLLKKDIPLIEKTFPFSFKTLLLKKPHQYLCKFAFNQFKKKKSFTDDEITLLIKILLWLPITTIGHVSELALTFEEKNVLRTLSAPKTCPTNCSQKEECFYLKALEKIKKSHLVLLNHSALIYHLKKQKIIPSCLIVDQTYHLEESLTKELGDYFSLEVFDGEISFLKLILSDEKGTFEKLQNKITLLFGLIGMFIEHYVPPEEQTSFVLDKEARKWSEWGKVEKATKNLVQDFKRLIKGIPTFKDFEDFILKPESKKIYEIRIVNEKIFLVSSPIHIGNALSKLLSEIKGEIFLTPVLEKHLKERLGIEDWPEVRFEPEFAWKKQAMVLIPKDIVAPASYDYTTELAQVIEDFTKALGGKTLALFTSGAQVENVYKKITPALKEKDIEVLAQRISGKEQRIVEKFKKNPRSVILASSNFFWEEIDIPGKKLSGVIITKLPFSYPGPLEKARQESYVNGFAEFTVPQALSKFKQGFSRLIRTKKDKGVVLVLDNRIISQSYGFDFLKAFPEVTLKYCLKKDIGRVVKEFQASEVMV